MNDKNVFKQRYMPVSDVIFQSSLIKSGISSTATIIAERIYKSINIISKLTNEKLASLTQFNEDLIRKNIPILLEQVVFINEASSHLPRKLISFFPTWNYCIGKIKDISIDAQEVRLFFPIPGLDIDGTIIFTFLSKEEFNLLQTINNQKYYLIHYQVTDILYSFPEISNVIIKATSPSKIIPIEHLKFNIDDREQPYLINKNSIIQEEE
jgi:hypothetical protein